VLVKTCTKCLLPQPDEAFSFRDVVLGTRQNWCKKCVSRDNAAKYLADPAKKNASVAKYRAAHPERVEATNTSYYKTNRDDILARNRGWRLRNKRTVFGGKLKAAFGLSLEDWDVMLVAQSGRCEVCGEPLVKPKEPCVDHDHKTGKVRALLCGHCNLSLGHAQESVARLQALIEYILKHSE
jgi:hypothetical protein